MQIIPTTRNSLLPDAATSPHFLMAVGFESNDQSSALHRIPVPSAAQRAVHRPPAPHPLPLLLPAPSSSAPRRIASQRACLRLRPVASRAGRSRLQCPGRDAPLSPGCIARPAPASLLLPCLLASSHRGAARN